MSKLLILAMLLIALFCASACAEDSTVTEIFKSGAAIDYVILCSLNNSVCPDSTTCNWTLFDPDNILIVDLQNFTRNADSYYNFTLSPNITNKTGYYTGAAYCSNGVYNKQAEIKFLVTSSGQLDSETNSTFYLLGLLIALAVLLAWFAHYMSEALFAFFSGVLFSISGIYVSLYGLGTGNNLIEYSCVVILIGLGMFMLVASSLAFLRTAEQGAEDTIFTRWIGKRKEVEED